MRTSRHHPFARALLALITLILPAPAALAQAEGAPTYAIGTIPDQRVWYNIAGQQLAFVVSAPTLGANPTITMTVDQNNLPTGPISFNPESREFRYVPAKTDAAPFTVAFLAVGSGEPIVQQITITPLPPVPPDSESFGTGPNAHIPDDESLDYLAVDDVLSEELLPFNTSDGTGVRTRSVTIIGKTVVLEAGHPNGLHERFSGQENIRELTIHAETVIVRDPLDLPQTDVAIHALELRFEDRAGAPPSTISTTPRIPFGDAAPPAVGSAGYLAKSTEGHDGGDLKLYVRELVASGAEKRFLLRGGRGRRASPGKNGTDAGYVNAVSRNWNTSNGTYNLGSDFCIAAWAAIDNGIPDQFTPSEDTYNARNGWTTLNGHANGSNDYPGAATPGGKPGDPGRGGAVESSLDLSAWLDNDGGAAGTVAPTAQGGAGVRVVKAGATPPYTASELSSSGRVTKVTIDCQWGGFLGTDPCASYTYTISNKTISSQDGADAPGPAADLAEGATGDVTTLSPDDLRWLSPQAMQVVLNYLNDAYLDGHFEAVSADLASYLEMFEIVMASGGWTALPMLDQIQLGLIRDDMQNLQHRIANNLDYFGNPAGWVPMLSFEVNQTAFDNEVDRALRVMYLNYWLGNRASTLQQQLDALRAMRTQLLGQIEADRTAYTSAVEAVPLVQVEAENVQLQIDTMLQRIRQLEDQLLPKAKSIVVLKRTARTLGKIAQTIPVYQPALGAAGGAVAASADIDPNKSWEENAILVGTGAAGGFAAGQPLAKAGAAQQSISAINTTDPEANAAAEDALRQAREPLLQLLRDSHSAVTSTKTSDPEVAAELQRLLADVPEYRVLQSDLLALNALKRDFFTRLADLIQRMTTTSLAISRNLRTVALMNAQISAGIAKLDPALVAYLHDMNRRARARLLKYHYYVSRAYAYRRLEAYPGTLNLQRVFDKFVELAESGATQEMNAAQFDSLKAVYEEQISSVAEAILGDLNSSPPEKSQVIEVAIPAAVVAEINAGKTGRFNLKDSGLFSVTEENFRITSITVSSMSVTFDTGMPTPAYADLVIRHSGISELHKDGKSFLFRHYSERTRNAISWKARRWFSDGRIDHSQPAKATESLIAALVPGTQDLLLYSRPAAFADLLLTLESNNQDSAVQLQGVTLRVSYDYTDRADQIKSLRIVGAPNGIEPEITLSAADRNGRGSGRGTLERFFSRDTQVTVSVPQMVGDFVFDSWIGGGIAAPGQATQALVMNRHFQLTPVYRSTVNYAVQVSGAGGSGTYAVGDIVALDAAPPVGSTFVRWDGPGVEDPTSATTRLYVFDDTAVRAVYEAIGSFSALINISNRALVGTGADILIPGFVIQGTGTKRILVRAVGPSLARFGVAGTLADPQMAVYRRLPGTSTDTIIASNDNWGSNANAAEIVSTSSMLGAFSLTAGSADAALLLEVEPGQYSVVASGVGETTGVAIVEVYDADDSQAESRLINISGRARVGVGEQILIPGFVVDGDATRRFLIRAVGPSLARFGVQGTLADPSLVVYKRRPGTTTDDEIARNDNWGDAAQAAQVVAASSAVGAFSLLEGSADAAVLIDLEPGAYTAAAAGVGDTTGVALVEVYEVAQ